MIKTYKNFEVAYYPEYEMMFWKIATTGIPNFSIEVLKEFQDLSKDIHIMFSDNKYPLKYLVSASSHKEVYNMGGDLPFFYKNIQENNRDALTEYANLCIDAVYNIQNTFGLPVLSIALVNGNAYGGGFECVMAHDIIVANEEARFCLPENKFHLFPGMGAYSFLCRKISLSSAMEILYSGDVYKAKELKQKGLINMTFDDNCSEIDAVINYISKNSFNFIYNHYKCIKKIFPLQKKELYDITSMWVEACMNMEKESLRRMELIIKAQLRKEKQLK
ncbi:crotonase/enoyl-CoA hydratase family protein [Tenacibaculum sp. ZS6-P6]|uniref:crotonase/enoyl-CoA hydratase family protein n=1 Tax=Tenacibaculum sp. ZS6-P6 TaxID=3447503 RepID=UPI003F99528A